MAQTNPVKAIREKCVDCCCGSATEVALCEMDDCPIWAFRFGKNPYRTRRELTPEQREKAKESLEKARLSKLASDSC